MEGDFEGSLEDVQPDPEAGEQEQDADDEERLDQVADQLLYYTKQPYINSKHVPGFLYTLTCECHPAHLHTLQQSSSCAIMCNFKCHADSIRSCCKHSYAQSGHSMSVASIFFICVACALLLVKLALRC